MCVEVEGRSSGLPMSTEDHSANAASNSVKRQQQQQCSSNQDKSKKEELCLQEPEKEEGASELNASTENRAGTLLVRQEKEEDDTLLLQNPSTSIGDLASPRVDVSKSAHSNSAKPHTTTNNNCDSSVLSNSDLSAPDSTADIINKNSTTNLPNNTYSSGGQQNNFLRDLLQHKLALAQAHFSRPPHPHFGHHQHHYQHHHRASGIQPPLNHNTHRGLFPPLIRAPPFGGHHNHPYQPYGQPHPRFR